MLSINYKSILKRINMHWKITQSHWPHIKKNKLELFELCYKVPDFIHLVMPSN